MKDQIQQTINKILMGDKFEAEVVEISGDTAKVSFRGGCGDACGCAGEAFETLKSQILTQHKEITSIERVA
ncbi:MAG TPA: hypothetical protein VJC11_03895 [Patescibacteria group bacterium]|nr:hypothetical protein [Patescibacteria group bacterium]